MSIRSSSLLDFSDRAAAIPAPWPVTAQQLIFRVAAWLTGSPPVARPATSRFFTFFGTSTPDPVALADWNGRGITPIHYDSANGHDNLRASLERWAKLSAINGKKQLIDSELRRIVKKPRSAAAESDRDLFDHFFRRGNASERERLSALVSDAKAEINWLDAIITICAETDRGRQA